jgi:hypothetical protein
MASGLLMSTPSPSGCIAGRWRSGEKAATILENYASAHKTWAVQDEATLLESRARDTPGQASLTPGQIALYFAPGDTNVFTGPFYPELKNLWLVKVLKSCNKNKISLQVPMTRLSRVLITLVGAVWLGSTASANLVVNPGFETGDFTGWTQLGHPQASGVDQGSRHSGTFGAFFGPNPTPGLISQDLGTVAGATYDLTFWLTNGGGSRNFFRAEWNGSVFISVLDNADAFDYTQFTFTGLFATGSTTALQFVGIVQNPSFLFFDDVSVTQSAPSGVPEAFSTLWLALPLAGLLGFSLLRRRVEV